MTKNEPTPRIYVACLVSYNAGRLYGTWIDASQEPEAITAEVWEMLAASPTPHAEEWAIHDYEDFYGCAVSEWASFEQVSSLASFIAEQGKLGAELITHFGGNIDEARQAMEENYRGEYKSLVDFVEEVTTDYVTIPEQLVYYIDYQAMARDMELNGDVFTVELGFECVHVFWSR